MKWVEHPQTGGMLDEDSDEWEEHYQVLGHRPVGGQPASVGLLADRPWFRPGQPHYDPSVGGTVKEFAWDKLGTTRDAWAVVVRYLRELNADENPLEQPAKITFDGEGEDVPIFEDADGKLILTTAGGLVTGLTEQEERIVFNVTKNLPRVPRWLLEYRNGVVNSDTVRLRGLSVGPGHLMLKTPRAGDDVTVRVAGQWVTYLPFSFSLVYHPRTWIERIYNRDLCEIDEREQIVPDKVADPDGSLGATKAVLVKGRYRITLPNKDGDEEEVDEPMFLDRNGRVPRDADGAIKTTLDPADIVVLEKWTKKRLPFSRLPLT